MDRLTQRLTREDWILAGFRAITAGGAGALRVEAVARTMGATKGSFYWHFADPADWRAAMLAYWEDAAFRQIVTSLEPLPPGRSRLYALVQTAVVLGRDVRHGGVAAEPALRDWARYAPEVAAAVQRVDAGRLAFVAGCFADIVGDAQHSAVQARIFYAALLGLAMLRGDPADEVRAMRHLIDALSAGPSP